MHDPFPPAPGSAQSQHTARLPGRLGLLALALVSAILGGVPGPSVHLLFWPRLLLAECQSRRRSDGSSVLPGVGGVHPPALPLLPPAGPLSFPSGRACQVGRSHSRTGFASIPKSLWVMQQLSGQCRCSPEL